MSSKKVLAKNKRRAEYKVSIAIHKLLECCELVDEITAYEIHRNLDRLRELESRIANL